MKKEVVATEKAPAAVGPYAQAIKIGELVYTSGQIGLVPGVGELVGDDVEAQTEQALQNLAAVLEAAGTDLGHVVKTTVFLRYMKDYTAVNQIYAKYFGEATPARSAVAVAALPLGAKVEIEAVAILPEASETKSKKGMDETATQFVTEAVETVETAVASGLRQIGNVLADIQKKIEAEREKKPQDK